jgi:hypothetical protein
MEKIIVSKFLLNKEEFNKTSEDQLRFGLNLQLIDILLKEGLIKYPKPIPDLFGKIEISSEIKVITEDPI